MRSQLKYTTNKTDDPRVEHQLVLSILPCHRGSPEIGTMRTSGTSKERSSHVGASGRIQLLYCELNYSFMWVGEWEDHLLDV